MRGAVTEAAIAMGKGGDTVTEAAVAMTEAGIAMGEGGGTMTEGGRCDG